MTLVVKFKSLRQFARDLFKFGQVRKSQILMLIFFTLAGAVFESISIALLLPILEFIESGKNVAALMAKSEMWKRLGMVHEYFGMEVSLLSLMGLVLGMVLVRQVFDFSKKMYAARMSEGILVRIRKKGFASYLFADLSFFSRRNTGDMVNSLMMDGMNASYAVTYFIHTLGYALLLIFYSSFLVVFNLEATASALVCLGLIAAVSMFLMRRTRQYGRVGSEFNNRYSKTLIEKLGAVRLIKLFAMQAKESDACGNIVSTLQEQKISVIRLKSAIDSFLQVSALSVGFAVIYLAVEKFHMGMAAMSVFIFVILRMLPLVQEFISSGQSFLVNINSFERVKKLIDEAVAENRIRGGKLQFKELKKGIRLENVGFSYGTHLPVVLENIELVLPARKMTAFAGKSGAGKSTLVDLLPRLIVPTTGKILYDDTEAGEFDLKSLRSSIAFVSQESVLFDASVMDNLIYGLEMKPDLETVRIAARQAYIDDFVMSLPEKYDTSVGERGVRLSGGQKQRLVLARALLRKSPIIILDEPTSALDSESESYIQKAIEELRDQAQTTLIVIAHRLSTIRMADQIIVLDRGRIIESGMHDDLLEKKLWYREMFRIQSGELELM